jgi:hypothetical protein
MIMLTLVHSILHPALAIIVGELCAGMLVAVMILMIPHPFFILLWQL